MVGMGVQKGYYASHRCVEEGVQGLWCSRLIRPISGNS